MDRWSNIVGTSLLGLALSMAAGAGIAGTELCAPLRNAGVDQRVVAKMLASAVDGHLYRIEASTSQMDFCVDSSLGNVKGRFTNFVGGLTFVSAVSSADDQQAMVLVHTDSIRADNLLIEELLTSEEFFDVKNYPEIVFVSREFRWVDRSEAVLIGDLTLHGVTRQVGLHVQLVGLGKADRPDAKQRIRVKATTLISRAEFGLGALSPMVSDAVSLCMSVDAVKFRAS